MNSGRIPHYIMCVTHNHTPADRINRSRVQSSATNTLDVYEVARSAISVSVCSSPEYGHRGG